MRTGLFWAIIALFTLMVSSACVNVGGGNSPETRYFLLEAKSTAPPGFAQTPLITRLAIGIGPVRVPRYLDRPQILTRLNEQEFLSDEFNQWLEPLKISIPRIMGENLSVLTGSSRIRTFPWNSSTRLDYRLSMDVLRFDADADGKVRLKATWRIVIGEDRHRSTERQSIIEKTAVGSGVGGRVEGLSLALADLSQKIATELINLNSQLKEQPSRVRE